MEGCAYGRPVQLMRTIFRNVDANAAALAMWNLFTTGRVDFYPHCALSTWGGEQLPLSGDTAGWWVGLLKRTTGRTFELPGHGSRHAHSWLVGFARSATGAGAASPASLGTGTGTGLGQPDASTASSTGTQAPPLLLGIKWHQFHKPRLKKEDRGKVAGAVWACFSVAAYKILVPDAAKPQTQSQQPPLLQQQQQEPTQLELDPPILPQQLSLHTPAPAALPAFTGDALLVPAATHTQQAAGPSALQPTQAVHCLSMAAAATATAAAMQLVTQHVPLLDGPEQQRQAAVMRAAAAAAAKKAACLTGDMSVITPVVAGTAAAAAAQLVAVHRQLSSTEHHALEAQFQGVVLSAATRDMAAVMPLLRVIPAAVCGGLVGAAAAHGSDSAIAATAATAGGQGIRAWPSQRPSFELPEQQWGRGQDAGGPGREDGAGPAGKRWVESALLQATLPVALMNG